MHRPTRFYAALLLSFCSPLLISADNAYAINFGATWYAKTGTMLRSQVKNNYLKTRSIIGKLPRFSKGQRIRALVVPHATTPLAAQYAALAYARVAQPKAITRLILIAPSTGSHLGASTLTAQHIETPLGSFPLDTQAQELLVRTGGARGVTSSNDNQHYLAHHIPLIQYRFTKAKLLPLIVSNLNERSVADLCYLLRTVVDDNTLVVFSSDVHDRERSLACASALNILEATEDIQLWGPAFVESINSSEHLTAAIRTLSFTTTEHYQLLMRARTRLQDVVRTGTEKSSLPTPSTGIFSQPLGLFVSLHAHAPDGSTRLRGCMGTLHASQPLHQTLDRLVTKAALHDPRFTPVTTDELKNLSLSLSIMLPTRPIHHPDQIQLGRHGVALNCHGMHSIFLPEVARHRHWETQTLLNNLCLKAGLPSNAWQRTDCVLEVFETITIEEAS